jgi:hypothetical protein
LSFLSAPRRLISASVIAALCVAALAAAGWRAAARDANTFDLRDFGAVGDGTTDDAPAVQAALDALAAAGGGTLHVPAGRYVIASQVVKDFTGLSAEVTIEGVASATTVNSQGSPTEMATGLGLASEFYPRTGEQQSALVLIGLRNLVIKDLAFVGTPGVTTDAAHTFYLGDIGQAVIRHCEFYGISSLVGAVIYVKGSALHVEQSKFLGTVSNSGIYAPVIDNQEWKSVSVADVVFIDYGLRPELFGKTGFGAPFAWVNVGNAAAVTPDSPRREVSVRRVFLDEGGYVGLSSLPFRSQSSPAPTDLYYITDLRMNVSNLRTSGHYFEGLNGLLVENSRYGWSTRTDTAINLLRSGHAIIDRIHTEASPTTLRAAPTVGSLTVINSVYENLASEAQVTRVINTAADADDPVWYVRDRFHALLGREPDPAAHFYWSRRLLSCADGDAACVGTQRAALDAYLGDGPAPTFAVEGLLTDELGRVVAGAAVSLSGSQTVATVTDAEGRYRFSNLPTSGVYTVTATKPHHIFAPRVFDTPAGDQNGDMASTFARYAIRGRLTQPGGAGLGGATLTLTGAPDGAATTTTDASGNYAFTGLPATFDYTITPTLLYHLFTPASLSITNLTSDRVANSTGTLRTHTIAGRVTTTGGVARAGVTVTLSGSMSATATTGSDGRYSFANVPAGGDYVVTPSGSGLVLLPASASFAALSTDRTADFNVRFRVNFARSAYGSTANGSSTSDSGRLPSAAINGDRRGLNWGWDPSAGGGWQDATPNTFPDHLEVSFGTSRTIDEVSVFSAQDNLLAPVEPTEALTFTSNGLTSLQVEHWTGSAWAMVPGGLVISNDKVWRKLTFAPLTTTKIRIVVNSAQGGSSRIVEVEAWGSADSVPTPTPTPTPTPPVNLALGRPATQSSEIFAAVASRAADGNTSGAWGGNSVTHTDNDAQAWWQTDLGAAQSLNTVKVWNRTDCCSERLSNFYILVSDAPFTSTSLSATLAQPGVSSYHVPGQAAVTTTLTAGRTGRYVRVQLAATGHLALAEVEVLGVVLATPAPTPTPPTNLAQGKPATQSSEIFGGVASRAVDGNTNGAWSGNSVTHTNSEDQPWWQVDLGAVYQLQTVRVWNRTDCCSERLSDFYVLVSDAPFASTGLSATLAQPGVTAFRTPGQAGSPTTINVNRAGRYVRVQLTRTDGLALAEVEVIGVAVPIPTPTPTPTPTPSPTPTPTNLAQGKPATQSSDLFGGVASRAADGNTNGAWSGGSVTHTDSSAQAWWQVDLGAVQQLQSVRLWNRTDCCSNRLSNFYVLVSDVPFTSTSLSETLAQAGVSSYHVPGQAAVTTTLTAGRTGRYVRVQLAGTGYLALAEVEVLGVAGPAPTPTPTPTNLALGRPATQSSDLFGGVAARAVDGNTSGLWSGNSVTHTDNNAQAWWEVDVGAVQSLNTIRVWNRTDCCSNRLSNFYVLVSAAPFTSTGLSATLAQPGVTAIHVPGSGGGLTTINLNRAGRYVRVQLAGTDYLALAEVEIF